MEVHDPLMENFDFFFSGAENPPSSSAERPLLLYACIRKPEAGRRKAQGARRKTQGARRKAQGARRRAQGARRKAQAGSRKPDAGSRKPEAGRRKAQGAKRRAQAPGARRKAEAGSRKPEGGMREIGSPECPRDCISAQPPSKTLTSGEGRYEPALLPSKILTLGGAFEPPPPGLQP